MEKRKIKGNKKDRVISEAYAKINDLKKKGYGIKDQSTDLKKWLEQQDEVEEVSVYGDTDITVKFKDKTQVGILLGRKKSYGEYHEIPDNLLLWFWLFPHCIVECIARVVVFLWLSALCPQSRQLLTLPAK